MKNKQNKSRKSMKGKWGRVGAPPKSTSFPKGAFTMETLFGRNKNQCELSLRTKVDAGLAAGEIIALKTRKQAGGKVGRPKAVFVLKENFNKEKHERADAKAKTPKTRTVISVSPSPVTPTAPPIPTATVVPVTAPATIEPPVETITPPTPEVSTPVEMAAIVEAPASAPEAVPTVG